MKNKFPQNPYPGLRPFEFAENHLFFGREGQSEELLRRLQESHFVAVVGTSGSGKSSLVRAGLLPLLYGGFMTEAGARWRVALFRPGDNPIHNLATALVRPAQFTSSASSASAQTSGEEDDLKLAVTETVLRRSAVGLRDYSSGIDFGADENLLVVVDQFEELFRFKKENQAQIIGEKSATQEKAENEAAAFVKLLLEATKEKNNRVYVIITMRSDFLGDCSQFRDLPETINNGQYLIPRLTSEQLRKAIESPARVKRASLNPALVARLLNDIGDDQDQLPVLQHALMRTWDEWAKGKDKKTEIGFDHYNLTGGMATALSKHADEAFFELGEPGAEELSRKQKIAEKLFKCLTETDRENRETRRATSLGKICAVAEAGMDEVISVINVFRQPGRTFLMPPFEESLNADTLIDISHESLIRKWERLKKWVEEEAQSAQIYRRLAEDAWLHQQKRVGFWSDPELKDALEWKEIFKPNATWAELYLKTWSNRYLSTYDEAIAYLEESRAYREKELSEEEAQRNKEIERERQLREQAEQLMAASEREAKEKEKIAQIEIEKTQTLEKSARKLKRYLYAVAAMSLLLLVVAGFAGYMAYKAQQNAKEAKKNEENAGFFLRQSLEQHDVITEQKKSLQETNDKIEKANDELVESQKSLEKTNDDLKKSLEIQKTEKQKAEAEEKRANEQAERAKASEDETRIALEQQKRLKDEALIAKQDAQEKQAEAEATARREEINRDALTLLEQGENRQALPKFQELLESYKQEEVKTGKPRIRGKWWALHNLGIVNARLRNLKEAEKSYKDALNILGEPQSGIEIQNSQLQILAVYNRQDDSTELEKDIKRSKVTTLRRLAQFYHQEAEIESNDAASRDLNLLAIRNYLRLLEILKSEESGTKQPSYPADVYVELADSIADLYDAESYDKAVEYYKLAEGIYAREENHAKQVYVLKKWANAALSQAKANSALNLLEKSIKIQEDTMNLSPTNSEIANTYTEIAKVTDILDYSDLQSEPFEDLVKLINEVNSKTKKSGSFISNDEIEVREAYFAILRLADAYRKIGNCKRAEMIYLSTINRWDVEDEQTRIARILGVNLRFYTTIGEFYQNVLKDASKAEFYFSKVAKEQEDNHENGFLDGNRIYNYEKAAEFYFKKGDYEKAQKLFEYVLVGHAEAVREAEGLQMPAEDRVFEQVEGFIKIAKIYEAQNKLTEAEAKYLEGLDLIEKKLGNLSRGTIKSQTAAYLYQLGEFYERHNQAKKALAVYREAYQVVMQETSLLFQKGQQARIEIKLASLENKLQLDFLGNALKNLEAYRLNINEVKGQNKSLLEFSRYSENFTLTTDYYNDLAEVYEALAKLESIESKKTTYMELAKKQRERAADIKYGEEILCK